MSDNPELITQFIAITGVDDNRARFYLESSAWKLDVAMSRFYENEGQDVEEIPDDNDTNAAEPAPRPAAPEVKSSAQRPKSGITTLSSLAISSDEDDEEEGQAFYAGGSEHSGQQVLGPSKKKDFVAGMFKGVQKHGVEVVDQKPGASKSHFGGTGYRLGQTADDTEVVAGASTATPSPEVTLKLWKDGFTVNDGEFRAYTDPANAEFLQSIQRGEIPHELRRGGSEVYLSMEDHRMEAFKASNRNVRAFGGQGYTLGSPAPPVIGASQDEDKPVNEARAKEQLKTDTTKPTTNIQIRLSDGSRLVAQFNHTHTVGDIRAYILSARPQYETREFNLISGYPSRVLQDSESLADANLLNSAIMQKLI